MAENDTPKELLQALDLIRGTRGPKPESLDTLESKHVERVRAIFEDRNIVAIGIAEKRTDNKETGELGLCFYVEKKIAKARVKPNKIIPPVLSVADRTAVFTDVQQIGKVRPQVNKRQAPLLSGFSIGNDTDTGTLGAIVQKGAKFFLLSNSHVLARSGKGKVGDQIIYPGDADKGGKTQKVGALTDILPFKPGDDFLNRVDAALAEVDPGFVDKLDFSIRGAKAPLDTADPVRDMKIVMRGRTSGDSEGVVQDVHFSIIVTYPGVGKVGFLDQVKCTRYSKGGDSGSIIVDKKSGKIVGLHFAGSPDGSIFNPISEVEKALKFRFADK
ncbi:MAG: hypothetical protein QOI12_3193 [Alphaproteobacteria bacterium]|jgi:hypothetical protein|nr:hypothetical protein [Alphaproteobacteria bacterium]